MSHRMIDDIEKVLLTEEDIQKKVKEIGARITHDYEGRI